MRDIQDNHLTKHAKTDFTGVVVVESIINAGEYRPVENLSRFPKTDPVLSEVFSAFKIIPFIFVSYAIPNTCLQM